MNCTFNDVWSRLVDAVTRVIEQYQEHKNEDVRTICENMHRVLEAIQNDTAPSELHLQRLSSIVTGLLSTLPKKLRDQAGHPVAKLVVGKQYMRTIEELFMRKFTDYLYYVSQTVPEFAKQEFPGRLNVYLVSMRDPESYDRKYLKPYAMVASMVRMMLGLGTLVYSGKKIDRVMFNTELQALIQNLRQPETRNAIYKDYMFLPARHFFDFAFMSEKRYAAMHSTLGNRARQPATKCAQPYELGLTAKVTTCSS